MRDLSLRCSSLLALSLLLLLACSSQQPASAAPPPQQAAPCGLTVFAAPACEAVVDRGCCAQEMDCAGDPGCANIVQCLQACGARDCSHCGGAATPGAARAMNLMACIERLPELKGTYCGSSSTQAPR